MPHPPRPPVVVVSLVDVVALPLVSTPSVAPAVVSLPVVVLVPPSVARPVLLELVPASVLSSLLAPELLVSDPVRVAVSVVLLESVAVTLTDPVDVACPVLAEESPVLVVASAAVDPSWCPLEDELP